MRRRVLVTFGGTSEKIDEVRTITNCSTGQLGSLIADAFAEAGAAVDCITTLTARRPLSPQINRHYIKSAADLARMMRTLLTKHRYDCVVHAMAVSDYTVDIVTTVQELETAIKEGKPIGQAQGAENGKISSGMDNIVVILRPTEKVIRSIKDLQPNTLLFGFKLLADATPDELEAAAMKVLRNNQCDYVVANDLRGVSENSHNAAIYSADRIIGVYNSKKEIAGGIISCVRKHWKE